MSDIDVSFIYLSSEEKLRCKKNEKMLSIMERISDVFDKNEDELLFLLNGQKVDKDLTFEEVSKGDYQIKILVYDIDDNQSDNNEMKINYQIESQKGSYIRIFGDKFVENNKNNCKIIYKEETRDICTHLDLEDEKDADTFDIKLIGVNNITNFSYMFYECENLLLLLDIEHIKTINIIDMSYMFYNCTN